MSPAHKAPACGRTTWGRSFVTGLFPFGRRDYGGARRHSDITTRRRPAASPGSIGQYPCFIAAAARHTLLRDRLCVVGTAALLQRMGVRPGLFDFLLIGPDGRHYWLELKRGPPPRCPRRRSGSGGSWSSVTSRTGWPAASMRP